LLLSSLVWGTCSSSLCPWLGSWKQTVWDWWENPLLARLWILVFVTVSKHSNQYPIWITAVILVSSRNITFTM
jgi:hypothetical protein